MSASPRSSRKRPTMPPRPQNSLSLHTLPARSPSRTAWPRSRAWMTSNRSPISFGWRTDLVAKPKGQPPEGLSEWLENELRDTKARLHKVEGELEQALKHSWSLETEIRKIHEAMAVSGSAVGQLSSMREELRQVRDQVSKAQDRQAAIANRTDEVIRQRQADTGRAKHEMSILSKQIEGVARGVGQFDERMKALEEIVRRAEDGVGAVRLAGQAIERQFEDVAVRGQRSLEAAVRLEQDVARITGDVDALRKIDAELDDKIRLILEGTRLVRSEERRVGKEWRSRWSP